MAKITIPNQTAPTTPSSGYSVLWIDSTTKKLIETDDAGVHRLATPSKNYATGQQTGFAADTYLSGSAITVPSFGMQIGQIYQWQVSIEKTAAGTGAITCTIRLGTAGTTSDTSRCALVQTVAQTATASVTTMFVSCVVRTVSASGVLIGAMSFGSSGTTTGFGDGDRIVSGAFDNSAVGGQLLGLSLNGNTSAAYTIDSCFGYLIS